MNYYYYDSLNQKQGPVTELQLKELAAQGVIGPHTPMETDTGHKGVAGQIPGLFPPAPASPFAPATQPAQAAPVPPPAVNVQGMGGFGEFKAGDIIILAACGMTLLSLFLPWISVTLPLVGTRTASGFTQSVCWLGVLLFVYPVLIVLYKKRTIWSQRLGMFYGVMGILLGTIHIFVWSKIVVVWEITKFFGKKPTFSDVFQDFSKIVSEDSCAGIGTFLFMVACIVLIVGTRMRHKNLD